jgi:hypothetical protein
LSRKMRDWSESAKPRFTRCSDMLLQNELIKTRKSVRKEILCFITSCWWARRSINLYFTRGIWSAHEIPSRKLRVVHGRAVINRKRNYLPSSWFVCLLKCNPRLFLQRNIVHNE